MLLTATYAYQKVGAWDHLTQKERERKERERNVAEAMNGTKTQAEATKNQLREDMMESISQRLAEFKKKTDSRGAIFQSNPTLPR